MDNIIFLITGCPFTPPTLSSTVAGTVAGTTEADKSKPDGLVVGLGVVCGILIIIAAVGGYFYLR